MKKIYIIIAFLLLFVPAQAEDNESNTYYFLFLASKDNFLKKCEKDSVLKILQSNILEDISFFEGNEMWETAYMYLSLYSDNQENLNHQSSIYNSTPKIPEFNNKDANPTFINGFVIESGVDYSSQNFELIGFESDSLITEKITSPNIGIRWNTQFEQSKYKIKNSSFIKNDKNYFTMYGVLKLELNSFILQNLGFKYYRLLDRQTFTYSFFQHEYDIQIGRNSELFAWGLSGDIRFKNYDNQTEYLKNYYYQNFSFFSIKAFNYWDISMYTNYLSLNRNATSEFDQEELIYFDLNYNNMKHEYQFEPEIRRYQYKHSIADSIEYNLYTDFSLNSNFKISINNSFNFCNYFELIDRQYQKQNENESNFIYFKLKPGIEWEINTKWAIKVSAITEKEIHSDDITDYEIDNFNSFGGGLDIEMISAIGFLMLQYEYIHRNNNNFLSSLSSFNHPANIHNINLSLNVRLSKNFSLSALINYDYDKNWKEGNLNTSQLVSLQLNYKLF